MNRDKYQKYKNKYINLKNSIQHGGKPYDSNLVLGMGPIGLFLAINLAIKNEFVTIVEQRFSFSRKQILLINTENFNTIQNMILTYNGSNAVDHLKQFARIQIPPIDNSGFICDNLGSSANTAYSIELSKLQYIFLSLIWNSALIRNMITLIYPNTEEEKFTITNPSIKEIMIVSNLELSPPKNIHLNNFNTVYLCTGGRDDLSRFIYTIYSTRTYPKFEAGRYLANETTTREDNIHLSDGLIVFLKPIITEKSRELGAYKKSCRITNYMSSDGSTIAQNRYRLFISPEFNRQSEIDVNTFVYLGIQFGKNELNGMTDSEKHAYVIECIELAKLYYDLPYDFEYDIGKNPDGGLGFFNTMPSFIENSVVKADNDKLTLCVVGDGMCKVNFFSGTGVNFGFHNVEAIMECKTENNDNLISECILHKLREKNFHMEQIFARSLGSTKYDSGLLFENKSDNYKKYHIALNKLQDCCRVKQVGDLRESLFAVINNIQPNMNISQKCILELLYSITTPSVNVRE